MKQHEPASEKSAAAGASLSFGAFFRGRYQSVKKRLGPLWWYAAILFCVMRFGDVINLFIGLYLVPKYVLPQELGAVLPLSRMGGVLALPLIILLLPCRKYLNTYATHGELGKVKRLLRDMLLFSLLFACGALLYAGRGLSFVFERMRVADGSLGILLVITGVTSAVAPVLGTAMEALKRFRLMAFIGVVSAPLRLATMLVCMPIRALSGYLMGQAVSDLCNIGIPLWQLRSLLFSKIPSVSYWKTDGMAMLRYAVPMAVFVISGTLAGMTEAFVIRHRLPDTESAAYYMLSRFAEIGNYVGGAVNVVLFPLVAERHARGQRSSHMLLQSFAAIVAGGVLLTIAFALWGQLALSLLPTAIPYAGFAPWLALMTIIASLRCLCTCYLAHEMACHRFRYIFYYSGLSLPDTVLLYCIAGYMFFTPCVPASWIAWIAAMNPMRLDFILLLIYGITALGVVGIAVHWLRQDRVMRWTEARGNGDSAGRAQDLPAGTPV